MKNKYLNIAELLRDFNTTSYKKWDNIIQVQHYKTKLFHYFNSVTLADLNMTSIKPLIEEK